MVRDTWSFSLILIGLEEDQDKRKEFLLQQPSVVVDRKVRLAAADAAVFCPRYEEARKVNKQLTAQQVKG